MWSLPPPGTKRPGGSRDRGRVAVAVGAPIGVLVVAFAMWQFSDRVGYVGPLDKATFFWILVVPVWLFASVVAGWSWCDLGPRSSSMVRLIVGTVVTLTVATLLWIVATDSDCDYGPRTTPIGWVVSSVLLGLSLGGGLVASGSRAAREIRAGRRLRAVVLGVGTHAGFVILAGAVLLGALLFQSGCQRPTEAPTAGYSRAESVDRGPSAHVDHYGEAGGCATRRSIERNTRSAAPATAQVGLVDTRCQA